MNPKRTGQRNRFIGMAQDIDFDYEAYKNRYKPNSVLLDPVTQKTYNVCKRATTHYRSRKYAYLNVNRIPLEFASTIQKGQPLVLSTDQETFLLVVERTYPPAEKWQNMTAKIMNTPLEFVEVLEKWLKSPQPTPTDSTT